MNVTASTTQADFFVADPITRNPPVPGQPSRRLVRYLLAILFGVAATVAWQSYGQATKQMIANWVEQLGWTKQLADAEHAANGPSVPQFAQGSTGAQTGSDKFPPIASLDPQEVHQMALDLAAVRQILEQIAAGQTKMAGEINNLLVTDMEMFLKIPAPAPAAAPSRKPMPVAPPLRAPNRRTDLVPDQSLAADNFRN